jgi:alpha-L-fucosidase
LLLTGPPDQRGLIHENDIKALQGWKAMLDREFKTNWAAHAKAAADSYRGKADAYAAQRVTDGDAATYWATDDDVTTGSIEVDLGEMQTVKYVLIQEYIQLGQRVKTFNVEVWQEDAWKKVADATTIGYKRILPIDPAQTNKVRINITASKACPLISNVEVY